jgi:hypothetical protein
MVRFSMRVNWKDVFKFLSGAFFVTAGASWYLSCYHITVPIPFFRAQVYPGVFGNTRVHTLRVVSDLLLLWVYKEVRKLDSGVLDEVTESMRLSCSETYLASPGTLRPDRADLQGSAILSGRCPLSQFRFATDQTGSERSLSQK